MKWIKNIGFTLAITGLLFIQISERQGVTSITLNSVYAIEHMPVSCDQYCHDEIDRQDALFRDYQVLYDKVFGAGALATIDLTYVNTTLLRAQIEAKCIQNSDNELADCEQELTNIRSSAGNVCSTLGALLGPLLGTVAVGGCIVSTHYAIAEVPQLCGEMKANGRIGCIQ
jgi:hypothetical protein